MTDILEEYLSPDRDVPAGQRVLVVSNAFPPEMIGGAEIVAQRQALALSHLGFKVSVFAGSGNQLGPLVRKADEPRVFRRPMRPVTFEESHRSPEMEAYFRSLLRIIRPTTVHFHNLPGLGAGLIVLAKAAGARVLVTLHDTWGFCLRQTILRDGPRFCANFTECDLCLASVPSGFGEHLPVRMRRDYVRWCLEQADRLLFPSRWLQGSYERAGFRTAHFTTLSNGIDLSAFPARLRDPQGKVRFLCASTLSEHKGAMVLWDALEILLRDATLSGRWSMVLAGDGDLAPELRARFERGALKAPVSWAGAIPRDAIAAAYDRADAVVLASICAENQPVTLLEALASGAAQLGTDVGGIPELVEHERSGLLLPPGDAAALVAGMRRLILDPALVRRFSARNLARREKFDEVTTTKRLADLILGPVAGEAIPEQTVVLCWGEINGIGVDSPTSRHLRRLDDRIRLLWHAWVPPEAQVRPAVLFVSGSSFPAGALGRAIIGRIPILAPRCLSLGTIPGCQHLLHEYDTAAEALDRLEDLAQT